MAEPKYRCPKCGNTTFMATAHVTQDWKLDENGQFLECVNNCIETTHYPNEDDVWDCEKCGYSDSGDAFRQTEDKTKEP